ncbi:MAG: metal-dependent hydrolase [Ignisphaera sp.]
MKRRTHNIFSFAIALWISTYLHIIDSLIYAISISLFFAIALNWLIDSLAGHKGMRRTPYTHSPIGVLMLSLLLVASMAIVLRTIGSNMSLHEFLDLLLLAYIVGVSHLFLDMLTADGVYLIWPFGNTKISLLKARYDNRLLNNFVQFLSIVIIVLLILKLSGYNIFSYLKFLTLIYG